MRVIISFVTVVLCGMALAQPGQQPEWIWTPEGSPRESAPDVERFFRKVFDVPEGVMGAWLEIAADNHYEAFVNGEPAGAGSDPAKPGAHDIGAMLQLGQNTLAIKVTNEGGPAGLIALVRMALEKGPESLVSTDATWKASGAQFDDWATPGFNDANWEAALSLGAAPLAPWESVDLLDSALQLTVTPAVVTPNGDGVNDDVTIAYSFPQGYRGGMEVAVMDPDGVTVKTFQAPGRREDAHLWAPRYETGAALAPGEYTVEVLAQGGGVERLEKRTFEVREQHPWPSTQLSMKDTFPIGVWYDGRVEGINVPPGSINVPAGLNEAREYYERTFNDIRERGLEIVVVPNTPPDYRQTLLEAANKSAVRVILELAELAWPEFGGDLSLRSPDMVTDEKQLYEKLREVVRPLRAQWALFAYQLIDEPPADLLDRWRNVSRILSAIDEEHPAFSCLCRENELDKLTVMKPQMLVFDRYPLRKGTEPGEYDFREFITLLETLRLQAAANDIPYWMVVQACESTTGLRYPTDAELRLMTHLALAHNAKGIFYFLYNSRTQEEGLQGLVDTSRNPAPIFDEVSRLANDMKRLRSLLLTLHPVENTTGGGSESLDVQMFEDPEGASYVFASNLDVLNATQFVGAPKDAIVAAQDMLTGEDLPVDTSGAPRFFLDLKAGGGRLVKLFE